MFAVLLVQLCFSFFESSQLALTWEVFAFIICCFANSSNWRKGGNFSVKLSSWNNRRNVCENGLNGWKVHVRGIFCLKIRGSHPRMKFWCSCCVPLVELKRSVYYLGKSVFFTKIPWLLPKMVSWKFSKILCVSVCRAESISELFMGVGSLVEKLLFGVFLLKNPRLLP
jgi:hypothetical protein